jgi:hypothetical protein
MAGPLFLVALIALIAAGGYTALFFVGRVAIPYPPSALPGVVTPSSVLLLLSLSVRLSRWALRHTPSSCLTGHSH